MILGSNLIKKIITYILLISLLGSVLPTTTYASMEGNNGGNGESGNASDGGSFSNNNIGYRIYIVNEECQVVSNVVDLLFDVPANKGVNYIAVGNTKVQPYRKVDVPSGQDIKTGNFIIYANDVKVLGAYTKGITEAVANSEYGAFNGAIPKPILPEGEKFKGNGKAFQEWFLSGEESFGSGDGNGGKNNKYEGGGIQQGNISSAATDEIVGICSKLEQNMTRYLALLKKEAGYDESSARAEISGYAISTVEKLNRTGKYTQEQQNMFVSTITSTLEKLFSSSQSMQYKTTEKSSIVDSLSGWFNSGETFKEINAFEIAKAAEDGKIQNITKLINFGTGGKGNYLFALNNSIPLQTDAGGRPSIIETCCYYNLKVCVEPILWFPPTQGKSKTSYYRRGTFFYGTPSNYGQFIQDTGFNDGGKGGWYRNVNNVAAAWSMWIKKDLVFKDGSRIESPIADDGTYPNSYETVPNSRLADKTQGIAFHYYYGKASSGLPKTPTYDVTESNPNPIPHEAQNPDPNTGKIPFVPGENKNPGVPITPDSPSNPEVGYLNTSRAVNIVKTYSIERVDGTLEHVVTKVQKNTPDIIQILHEPSFKVKEYFSSKDFYDYVTDDKLKDETTWEEILTTVIPTDSPTDANGYNQEFTWEEISEHHQGNMNQGGVPAGDNSLVKLWIACEHFDIDKIPANEKPVDLSRTDISHYGDNTLYVHLVCKEEIPQSHTFDNHNHPNAPNDSPEPIEDNPNHPEYPPVTEDNRYLTYRVVKVYEEVSPDSSIAIVNIFDRHNAPPIYEVEDEKAFSLVEWQIGDNGENWIPSSGETWEEILGNSEKVSGGESPSRVNMLDSIDQENDKHRTLYVRLRRAANTTMYDGDIVIQQSQLNKTIHTNDSTINVTNGYWGNYEFRLRIGPFQEEHIAYFYHCCCKGPDGCECEDCPASDDGSCCGGHECKFQIPGAYGRFGNGINNDNAGDDLVTFSFWQTSEPDPFEIEYGVSPVLNSMTLSAFPVYEKTVSSPSGATYTFSSDGRQEEGVEWITSLWRGGGDLKDIPTMALYKQDDISNQSEIMNWFNWEVPDSLLSHYGSNANKVSNKLRATEGGVYPFSFDFGIWEGTGGGAAPGPWTLARTDRIGEPSHKEYDAKKWGEYSFKEHDKYYPFEPDTGSELNRKFGGDPLEDGIVESGGKADSEIQIIPSDLSATAVCSNCPFQCESDKESCPHVNCRVSDTREFAAATGSKMQYTFMADLAVQFFAGKIKSLAAQPFGGNVSQKALAPERIGTHKTANLVQGVQEIAFYPYIRMTFMTSSLNALMKSEDLKKYKDFFLLGEIDITNPNVLMERKYWSPSLYLATLEQQNKDRYVASTRYSTYVLSEYESRILPNDAVIVGWTNPNEKESMLMTSQQWSLHKSALDLIQKEVGEDARNQILPGGAIYQLSTPSEKNSHVKVETYQTIVDDKIRQNVLSEPLTGEEYTPKKVFKDHKDLINQVKSSLDNLRVVQWVNKDIRAKTAWGDFVSGTKGKLAVLGGGTDLHVLGLNIKSNNEDKYYMKPIIEEAKYMNASDSTDMGNVTTSNGVLARKDTERANEGDLDVIKSTQKTIIYKLFTDTSGNVYTTREEYTDTKNIEQFIQNYVDSTKDLNYDTMHQDRFQNIQYIANKANNVLADRSISAKQINAYLETVPMYGTELKIIDDRTKFFTNVLSALTRNMGSDKTAEWAVSDGRWYNEAFDGIYMVNQVTDMTVALALPNIRTSVLDPALCPINKGQRDLYTKAYLSQFCMNSKSDWEKAKDKKEGYIGTFREGEKQEVEIYLPDMQQLYQSRKFYIPNANVQDLN